MKNVRMVALICMGIAASGCTSIDVASRNAPFEAPTAAATTPAMKVVSYQVRVPQTLKVSEANMYYPSGDIVWRGEPLGDRHAQVRKIFEESLARGSVGSTGRVPVLVDVEVKRFHALSEKTRYTVGGRHEIMFVMNFLNPETLQPVAEPRDIDATFKAFGGARAVAAEQNGITQRVRIGNHLAGLFQKEFGVSVKREPAPVRPIPVDPNAVSQNAVPLLTTDKSAGLY
ncbi:DUF6778 family protein [Marimonas arenosa]|uniref:Lipoprotein n=1 Tax=Marimonas arenosa TaxID=1795305 RepID=A0AAE4B2J6_9RHOB|nr:DUF6778 family protein [Marimonas arenosa]MDQ2089103.1 hypothetical protein [Marimonas arenosa]